MKAAAARYGLKLLPLRTATPAVAASRRSFVYWPYPTSLRPPRTEHPWVDFATMQALEFGFMTPGRWFVIAQHNTPDLLIQASRVLCASDRLFTKTSCSGCSCLFISTHRATREPCCYRVLFFHADHRASPHCQVLYLVASPSYTSVSVREVIS
ncbi:unnamed protein product [Symbiodinium necroappetens]|uniref:Uncharacterized protein n=1 Tax=Symbiodinium necroappetens TaxID=1628268 RepID=A0A812L8T3_9DINO|nr:unnamed protein product [Symbiodinium necroappetens]